MIEVDVMDHQGVWNQWWENFRNYYIKHGVDMDDDNEITRVLAEWNAIDLDQESTVFYFEHERDQVMFMLRWT